jgi:hypothetical protein
MTRNIEFVPSAASGCVIVMLRALADPWGVAPKRGRGPQREFSVGSVFLRQLRVRSCLMKNPHTELTE